MDHFNWDDLRFFLALARDGQLSGAARALGTSHVTVARRIERLEEGLGQRLFERSARGYGLTPAGRRLIAQAEKMEEASALVSPDEARDPGLSGVLRMAVPEGFGAFFSDRLLGRFLTRFPGLTLDLITLTQVLSLSRREADVTVTLDPVQRGGWQSEKLCDYALSLYGAPALLDEKGLPERAADLSALPFVGYIEEMLITPALDYLDELRPGLRPVFRSASIFNQAVAAQRGLGLAVLPCYVARTTPGLVPVLSDQIRLRRSYWLTAHRDHIGTRRLRLVRSWLMSELAAHQPELL
ncbi:LysR family transcriptional regulator [Falsigemmobacter faecalis]|uniref:LysR family transcriptional regulator n=1 Tax=Falsigemmobacter faecalis TaxID=2488730 RepID=A0A3P3DRV8_9RHOB|nr:LysR family transcriptional regulator [Falsigemmobacter faecalis]RRH76949.1 LysR family transcriptional regulator [Falsigemmobacter faecalis]